MRVLVTGGAGFIGSHLVDALLTRGDTVRVLDNLATGLRDNVNADAELVEGDIADPDVAVSATAGVDLVFHQAALGSVPRSIADPLATDRANAHGTLSVLEAARGTGVRRVVVASSSSVYGGLAPLPTNEGHPVAPQSPYAISKVAAEHYTRVYASLMDVETVCLRYFNVYGPRQRADSPYAAAIPQFIAALRAGTRPVVYGDGLQTRDFTFVADVVTANLLAAETPAERCNGRVFNVAGGRPWTILELLDTLKQILGSDVEPEFSPPRAGDVRQSAADISAGREELGYEPAVDLETGLRLTVGCAPAS